MHEPEEKTENTKLQTGKGQKVTETEREWPYRHKHGETHLNRDEDRRKHTNTKTKTDARTKTYRHRGGAGGDRQTHRQNCKDTYLSAFPPNTYMSSRGSIKASLEQFLIGLLKSEV